LPFQGGKNSISFLPNALPLVKINCPFRASFKYLSKDFKFIVNSNSDKFKRRAESPTYFSLWHRHRFKYNHLKSALKGQLKLF
jgi:hypothetical protein